MAIASLCLANDASATDDVQARISENLQAYLGDIASQLANQTVTVGGFALPEPQPDPFLEQNDTAAFDLNSDDETGFGGTTPNSPAGIRTTSTPVFGGYDSGGQATSSGGGSNTQRPSRVSVDA